MDVAAKGGKRPGFAGVFLVALVVLAAGLVSVGCGRAAAAANPAGISLPTGGKSPVTQKERDKLKQIWLNGGCGCGTGMVVTNLHHA